MAHKEQIDFCLQVKQMFPEMFTGRTVLDCGSLDINGNNRYLFTGCQYTGIDLIEGDNVDEVCPVHRWEGIYDVVICTEMLEHDRTWEKSLQNMANMARHLLIVTTAGRRRPEHGTRRFQPEDSPATLTFYRNMDSRDFDRIIGKFKRYEIQDTGTDIYFWGLK